jgi:aminopeptidase N
MIKLLKIVFIVLTILVTIILITIFTVMYTYDKYDTYASGGQLNRRQAGYDIKHYLLDLNIDPENEAIAGSATITMTITAPAGLDTIELDLVDNFTVSAIEDGSGQEVLVEHDSNKLFAVLPQKLATGSTESLTIHYAGRPVEAIMPPWITGFVWSEDEDGKPWVAVTSQGDGSMIWFPCKNHPSDEADSIDLYFTVPEDLYCAANGRLQQITTRQEGTRTFHWRSDYPINNYNITLNIGNYRELESIYYNADSSLSMPVRFYYLPRSQAKAAGHLQMAVTMLYSYRKFYGEYPWLAEKFAIVETDYLGMEHQTINAYGNEFRYDTTASGLISDWLMLHEMGHEWWGNKVSVADWADFWIHEGICTFGEALFYLDQEGEEGYHRHMQRIGGRIANEKAIVRGKNINSQSAYHGDIYAKGAWFMHSLRHVLGDSLFFPVLKKFATDPAYSHPNFVATSDFLGLVEAESGRDFSGYFDFFLRTRQLLKFTVDSLAPGRFHLALSSTDFALPLEVDIGSFDIVRLEIDGKGQEVKTAGPAPILDPRHWLLKEGDFGLQSAEND